MTSALAAGVLTQLLMPAAAGAALFKGDLVVADAKVDGGGGLIRVDPVTGAESTLSSNAMAVNASNKLFARPYTLATSSSGRIYVANSTNLGGSCPGGCGGVIEVNPSTGAESVLSSNAMPVNSASQYFRELTGIGVNPEGNIIVTSWDQGANEGNVLEVNSETGKEMLISSNTMPVNASSKYFAYPQGIVADAAGEIFVADGFAFGGHGGVIEVNPATGKETEISGNNMPVNASSQLFRAASQLVFNEAGNLVVASWCQASKGCSSLVEVNPATGKETLLSSDEMPVNAATQLFSETTSVAVEGTGRIVEAQENGLGGSCHAGQGCGGLVYVDPATGKDTELSANDLPVNAGSQLYAEPFDVVEYGVTPWPGPGPTRRAGSGGGTAPVGGRGQAGGTANGGGLSIWALRQTHNRWREPPRRRRKGNAGRIARGTVFSFTLNQPATVKLAFSLGHRGRSVHGACRAPSRRSRRGRTCTYWRAGGALTISGHAGNNTVAFAGRLSRRRALRPGRYRLRASAVNAHASIAANGALYFTILR